MKTLPHASPASLGQTLSNLAFLTLTVSGLVFFMWVSTALAATKDGFPQGSSTSSTFPKVQPITDPSQFKPHVGVMLGAANLNGNYSQDASFLLDIGFQPIVPFSFDTQIQHTQGDVEGGGGKSKYNTTNLLFKQVYNFGGRTVVLRDSYIGLKVGGTLTSRVDNTDVNFSAGPTLGFDIPIDQKRKFSLGAEATYLAVLGENAPDQAHLLGAMKYWF